MFLRKKYQLKSSVAESVHFLDRSKLKPEPESGSGSGSGSSFDHFHRIFSKNSDVFQVSTNVQIF
jgi:hypothetical protein